MTTTPTATARAEPMEPSTHWQFIATQWAQVRPPLRPEAGDIRLLREHLIPSLGSGFSALILGVTPELYELLRSSAASVRAIDRSGAMIDHVWPGPASDAACGDWRAMPYSASSFDAALCDGGLHLLDLHGQQQLAAELGRVIRPGGYFAVRLFELPDRPEHPEAVLKELERGRIGVSEAKLRLGMSLQGSPSQGVSLVDVWFRYQQYVGDPAEFSKRHGLDEAQVRCVESYRNSKTKYHFVSRTAAIESFQRGGFNLLSTHESVSTTLCPTLIFRAMGGDR